MQFEELRYVCQEAAIDLAGKESRPLPPTVVLPGEERTRLLKLPDFPEDDDGRAALLAQLAADEITAKQAPAWGFVAEADVGGTEAVVVVYGARLHSPEITAAALDEDGALVEFEAAQPLDPSALPYLHPLQRAVDALPMVADPSAERSVFDL